jgi:hypothetical protein
LPPGAFTAILVGKSDGTGINLVKIYAYTKIRIPTNVLADASAAIRCSGIRMFDGEKE